MMYAYQYQRRSMQSDRCDLSIGFGGEDRSARSADRDDGSDIFTGYDNDEENDEIGLVGCEVFDGDFSNEDNEENKNEDELIDAPLPDTEENLRTLSNKELKTKLAARGLLQQGRKEDLIQRILNPQQSYFKGRPKVEKWKNSKAKAFLVRLIMDETSDIHRKSPEEVWKSSEWFQQYPKHRFIDNMKNLKNALEARERVVQEDIRLIQAELAALNLSDKTMRGYPHWHTHAANKLLADDLKFGRNGDMKPLSFRNTRDEYKNFPLQVFRRHIYQEQRKQRELPLKIAKRNQLGRKKYEHEVEAEAARWHAEKDRTISTERSG